MGLSLKKKVIGTLPENLEIFNIYGRKWSMCELISVIIRLLRCLWE